MNLINDIKILYEKIFGKNSECCYTGPPRCLSKELQESRLLIIEEELYEYQIGVEKQDLNEILDALVDLMVCISGTIYLHGFTEIFPIAWDRVQKANLTKKHGKTVRNMPCDMEKPDNWKAPYFGDLL